jgi:2'-5'-oligoadenylate synthetase
MKVQVNLKVASQTKAISNFDLTVNAEETVQSVKDRIAASQLIAFPDQDLVLDGKVLDDTKTLADYDVQDSNCLDFVIKATEDSLAQQLAGLLQARDLSTDELGLLYCYKHGVSINQALKTIGCTEKFPDFIKKQKQLFTENGRVSLVRSDTKMKPFCAGEEIQKILQENGGRMDIQSLCSKFTQKFNVSIQSVVNMRPAEFLEKEKDLFSVAGRGQVTLRSATEEQQKSPKEVQPRAQRQRGEEVKSVQAKAPVHIDSPKSQAPEGSDSQEYLDLHNTISGRSFNSKVVQILNDIVEVVTEKSFLNISEVVKGGSVGKGTAISGTTDAEVVFFLKGMPKGQQSKWLPPLLKAVAAVLTQHLSNEHGVEGICPTDDSVHMTVKGCVEVELRFSPDFESFSEVIQAMGQQGPDIRKHFNTSLVKEQVQFVSKQPGQVKVTMRLLKWWRNQQRWTSPLTTPSDEILELLAVYSALQTKPRDQKMAIANAMSLMARFEELRIVWSNYYSKEDIWSPLLQQRPLLMDPVNPYLNVADPQTFDASELMSLAQSTHFFW